MQSFNQIIQNIRTTSINAKQAGTKFEILVLRWFLATPLYDVKRGWLWADFAKAIGKEANDLGIDLVLEMNDGEFWAIQCKFYNKSSRIDEDKVAHFLGHQGWKFTSPLTPASLTAGSPSPLSQRARGEGDKLISPSPVGRGGRGVRSEVTFSRFVWVDTDAVWGKNAEKYVHGRDNFTRLSMSVLASSNVDWDAIVKGKETHIEPKKPRDYQKEVIHKAEAHFKNNERGKVIMACGTGKTLTSQRIAEAVAGICGTLILYCVPSIALLGQTYQSWAENATSLTPSVAVGDISPSLSINGERRGENDITPSPFMERGSGGEVDKTNYIVKKMKFEKDKRILYYNADIRIENIPLEVDEYIVNGRSALGWLVDQYQVSTDKASGIVNDPNDWAREHDYPRYILDLVLRIIELSVRTIEIVRELPVLAI